MNDIITPGALVAVMILTLVIGAGFVLYQRSRKRDAAHLCAMREADLLAAAERREADVQHMATMREADAQRGADQIEQYRVAGRYDRESEQRAFATISLAHTEAYKGNMVSTQALGVKVDGFSAKLDTATIEARRQMDDIHTIIRRINQQTNVNSSVIAVLLVWLIVVWRRVARNVL